MARYLVEETYAMALYNLTQQTGETEQILAELSLVSETFQMNQKYFMLLKNPRLGKSEKKGLVKELFQEQISGTLMNFLMVLFDKRRISDFPGIAKRYREMVYEGKQMAEGLIVTAVPLEEEQMKRAEEETAKLMRKDIRLKNKVDPAIIGGMKIYVDDQVIDASVRNRLKSLWDSFKTISI